MKNYFSLILFSVLISIIFSCKKETTTNKAIPIITTLIDSTTISTNGAVLKGIITSNGGSAITEKGICWNTLPNPTIDNTVVKNSENNDTFQCNASPLNSSTIYYARAYAKNKNGIAYGNEISFQTNFTCGDQIKDIDGNIYHTVNIGGQCWTVENLTTTKYNDGTPIPNIISNSSWSSTTTGAYSIYDNLISNNTTYGKLYNWYAVNSGKLAPKGWHIPSELEWNSLMSFLVSPYAAGLRTNYLWQNPTVNTNATGFTALPGGHRNSDGTYCCGIEYTDFWSSTQKNVGANTYFGYFIILGFNYTNLISGLDKKSRGCSVRCVKD
jgi:uncharacterized protein (TIGR02145 family)